MEFSLKTYWEVTLLIPAIVIIFALIVVLFASFGFWRKPHADRKKITGIIQYLFCVCIFCGCLLAECRFLFGGGLHLLWETETDAVTCSGTVERICEPSERLPGFKVSHCYGADITINGQQYFAVTCGDIEEGDTVTIRYLPESHFILSIYQEPAE